MFDLSGKTVVVTGGGRGIGRGIVRAVAQAGASVVVAGRSPGPLEEAVREARALGARAVAVPTDITRPDSIEALVAAALAEGGLDCWVNNAGSADPSDVGPLIDLTEDQFDAVVDLNLKWTFFAAQAAARAMTGGGSIINISSRSGSKPCPMTGQYGAAKAGIESFTGTMAAEWGHLGIRVNAIAPGVVVTETNEDTMSAGRRVRQIQTVPLQRLGTPDDVGPLCVYFAADESSWVTGSVVQVTGGSPVPVGYLSYLHHKNKDLV
ncbi:MAG: family oxidoreductase [Blastococcus sp.]|nr:family oxidoreductase [Blastococcus sp.]